jgi:hypothetical protein
MTGLFIIIIAVFLWAGFVCAISFMESWLKFRAPGLTMPAGLSVGKLVFSALNKVEWLFTIVIVAGIFFNRDTQTSLDVLWLLIIVAILVVQTAWLLPALNTRAKAIINGKTLPKSSLHWYFVIAEFVKLSALIIFGINLLKIITQ